MSGDNAHIAKLRECLCIYLPDGYITLIRALRRGLKKKTLKMISEMWRRRPQTEKAKQWKPNKKPNKLLCQKTG